MPWANSGSMGRGKPFKKADAAAKKAGANVDEKDVNVVNANVMKTSSDNDECTAAPSSENAFL